MKKKFLLLVLVIALLPGVVFGAYKFLPGSHILEDIGSTTHAWLGVYAKYIYLQSSGGLVPYGATAYQTLRMNSSAGVSEMVSGETLLSVTTISLGADGNTTIFTVPTGRTAVLTRAYLVAAADAGTSTLTIGQAGALTDFLGTQTLSAIDAAGDVGFLSPIPHATTPKIEAYSAGKVIKAAVGSHAGSAGNTLYLFGFVY